ncbi:hypothetical protein FDP41_011448 [Naegleria fowleri]|uniref:Brix domain-containing protein n=1 Tax=Naegleria fowleri TaxID=5763 RepID=A0A6A5CA23_NAEFO|nr:uncharacterized protein FDP41_011448 [Naegleria fowleri]KAF0982518.1 hypothetical protein FDP41_011448 [Naegleria fowleri]CAG4713070.1 unnamed protein product [Naegleria fowleri]
MIRKNARLRREFLYKKSLQKEERERLDRKIRIREALEKGIPISEEDIRKEAEENEFGVKEYLNILSNKKDENDPKAQLSNMIDNEYANAGAQDPKILITTALDPSDRLKRFMKELRFLFPNCQRMNRGRQQNQEIVDVAIQNGFTDLIMVHENKGEPDTLIVSHLPHGPTAYFTMFNVVMRHEVLNLKEEKMPQQYPHLIFHNFKTKLGERVATILKNIFPVPKQESNRIVTFANDNDFISFRHHVYMKNSPGVVPPIQLKEVGPRFELQLFQIRLGTLADKEAELEWVLRPYMNTASKRQALGASRSELTQEESNKLTAIK